MIPPTPVAHGHHDAVVAEDSHGALSVRGPGGTSRPAR